MHIWLNLKQTFLITRSRRWGHTYTKRRSPALGQCWSLCLPDTEGTSSGGGSVRTSGPPRGKLRAAVQRPHLYVKHNIKKEQFIELRCRLRIQIDMLWLIIDWHYQYVLIHLLWLSDVRNLIFFSWIYSIFFHRKSKHGYTDPIDKIIKIDFFRGRGVTYSAGLETGSSGDTPAGWGNSGGWRQDSLDLWIEPRIYINIL